MRYLVSVIDDTAGLATPDEMAAINAFNDDRLKAEGHWVFAGGLAAPSSATVIDNRGGEAMFTDGPFLESKEYLAGFWIIEAADLDVALQLAAAVPKACTRKSEVRPERRGASAYARLWLIFSCCHRGLAMQTRVALTLRMVGGLSVPEIARAFLVRETAMGQRITRAKAKIKAARIPYRVPSAEDLPARVSGVLAVLFLVFNEGYLATGPGTDPVRHDLIAEAIRLTRLIRALMPEDGEVAGLLALMLLTEARRTARVSAAGALVTLVEQDRGTWAHALLAHAP